MSLPFPGESESEWDCERKSGCWKNEHGKINYVGTGYTIAVKIKMYLTFKFHGKLNFP